MALDNNYNGLTKLKDWWGKVKANFTYLDNRISTIITTPAEGVSAQEIIDARKGELALGDKIDALDLADSELFNKIGNLSNLTTIEKTNLVGAVSEVKNEVTSHEADDVQVTNEGQTEPPHGLSKNKIDATTAPTATNDSTEGYSVNSIWIDTTNDKAYICLDATSDSAVWKEIGKEIGISANVPIVPSVSAPKIQYGETTITVVTAGTVVNKTVTFPEAFAIAPTVILCLKDMQQGNDVYCNLMSHTSTTTYFIVYANTGHAQTLLVRWYAIG